MLERIFVTPFRTGIGSWVSGQPDIEGPVSLGGAATTAGCQAYAVNLQQSQWSKEVQGSENPFPFGHEAPLVLR